MSRARPRSTCLAASREAGPRPGDDAERGAGTPEFTREREGMRGRNAERPMGQRPARWRGKKRKQTVGGQLMGGQTGGREQGRDWWPTAGVGGFFKGKI